VGWISYFHLNRHNRSAGLEIVIDPDERRNGLAAKAVEILCRHLFKNQGLNKVIFQVAEPNDAAIALLEKLGMKRDGTLRRHYFIDGEYQDGYIYTMLNHESPW
ncbi:MAG: GNAT family N-acetyltransferase, partial [Candidatus Zixiibacteriota bacterium]